MAAISEFARIAGVHAGGPGRSSTGSPNPSVSVTIRPIKAGDTESMRVLLTLLSPETVRLRFFTAHPVINEAALSYLVEVDHHDREALVAIINGQIVGVARYDRLAGEATDTAEIAFVVADDWQRRGIATQLFTRLQERALENGITTLVADTLAENREMRRIFTRGHDDTRRTWSHGVVRVEIPLHSESVRS